jgi:hypothetical protein
VGNHVTKNPENAPSKQDHISGVPVFQKKLPMATERIIIRIKKEIGNNTNNLAAPILLWYADFTKTNSFLTKNQSVSFSIGKEKHFAHPELEVPFWHLKKSSAKNIIQRGHGPPYKLFFDDIGH